MRNRAIVTAIIVGLGLYGPAFAEPQQDSGEDPEAGDLEEGEGDEGPPSAPPASTPPGAAEGAPAAAPGTTRIVTGRVRAKRTREPIAGATITVKGTEQGAISEIDGRFTLLGVPTTDVTLLVTSYDHESAEVPVSAAESSVVIELALQKGEEIVVIDRASVYGRQNLANGASVVRGEDMTRVSTQTLDQTLQGKVSGVNIQSNSGAPGGGLQVQMRGVSTIYGFNYPLYVVDGVIVSDVAIPSGLQEVTRSSGGNNASATQDNQVNRIADLNLNDIESIEVLKGASAAAMYGSKASNGVVLITTKRGRRGKARVNVVQRLGTYQVLRKFGRRTYTSAEEVLQAFDNPDTPEVEPAAQFAVDRYLEGGLYDHEDEIMRDFSVAEETSAQLSGGTDQTTYLGSIFLRDDPGILKGTFYQKQAGRASVTHNFGRLRLQGTTNLIHSLSGRGMTQNDNAEVSHYMVLAATPSFVNLRQNQDGTFPVNPFVTSETNPLQTVALMKNDEDVWRLIGSLNANLNVINTETQVLGLSGNFGVDRFQQKNDLLFPPVLHFEPKDGLPGTSLNTSTENLNLNFDANAIHTFYPENGLFRAITSFGYQYETRGIDRIYVVSRNLNAGLENVDSGTVVSLTEDRLDVRDQGGYLQEEVSLLDDQLSLIGAIRGEQSSANGDHKRLFWFPKAAANYRFSGLPADLEMMRARVAYGEAGNQPIYGWKFRRLVADNNIDGNPGLVNDGVLGNPNIRPERQREIEAGFDLVGFDGRGVFEVTVYQKTIHDLLLQQTVAPSTGYSLKYINGGELRNRGLEVMFQITPVQTPDFRWVSRNIFFLNRAIISSLPDELFAPDAQERRFRVGGFGDNYGSFYIEEGASATQIVGNSGLKDDGMTCCALKKLGDATPTFRMSFVNNFSLGDVGVTSLVDWQQGSNVINLTRLLYDALGNSRDYAEAGAQRYMDWAGGVFAGAYVEDATFVKLRELSVYYRLPQSVLGAIGSVESAQVSVSGRNLLMFTPYSGLDPEVSNFGRQSIARNIDVAPYPPSRSLWVSVEASF